MRVDHGRVDPGVAGVQTGQVEVAHGDHCVLGLAVNRVPVDVEVLRELVILLELLELGERVADQSRVENADVSGSLSVGAQGAGLSRRARVVRNLFHIRQVVGVAGEVDVALNIGFFERLGARHHLEALHDPRVQRAEQEAAHDQQRGADNGQAPAADEGREEEQDSDDGGDSGQDGAARNRGVHVGVAGAGDDVVGVGQRGVLVEPDTHGLQHQVEGCRAGNLDAGGLGNHDLAPAHPDRAIQVARSRGDEGRDEHHGRREAEHGVEEGEIEQIERDVQFELGVNSAGVRAVQPHQNDLPAGGRGNAGEQTQQSRDAVHGEAAQRLDDLLVAVELRVELRIDRPQAVSDLDARPDGDRHRYEPDQKQHGTGEPLRGQHGEETQLVEPENVGIEPGENEEDDHQPRDNRCRNGKGSTAALWRGSTTGLL